MTLPAARPTIRPITRPTTSGPISIDHQDRVRWWGCEHTKCRGAVRKCRAPGGGRATHAHVRRTRGSPSTLRFWSDLWQSRASAVAYGTDSGNKVRPLREVDQVQNLAEVLSLERRLVAQMHQLIDELPEGNAYRVVLERHIGKLEQAIDQLEELYREDEGAG